MLKFLSYIVFPNWLFFLRFLTHHCFFFNLYFFIIFFSFFFHLHFLFWKKYYILFFCIWIIYHFTLDFFMPFFCSYLCYFINCFFTLCFEKLSYKTKSKWYFTNYNIVLFFYNVKINLKFYIFLLIHIIFILFYYTWVLIFYLISKNILIILTYLFFSC